MHVEDSHLDVIRKEVNIPILAGGTERVEAKVVRLL